MIDRREKPLINNEIEGSLQELSDTDIMMNFLEIIEKIYPNLIHVKAYCYDSWDAIIEPLYFTTVFETFSWKYGIKIERENCHIYESEISSSYDKNHIECRPKQYPLMGISLFEECNELSEEFLSDKRIVFVCFSDGMNTTTGSISKEEASKMKFAKAEVRIISKNDDPSLAHKPFYFGIQDIEFEFVAI